MSPARLAHRLEGPEDAPVVVLASSLGTTAAMWDGVAPALAERYRVLRYDHRGHGGSEVPPGEYSLADLGGDVLALLDRLGIERASFCGVSLGGMVGLWLALEAPQRIERLALLCTAAWLGPPEAWAERISAIRAHGQEAIADAVVGRWFTPGFAERDPDTVQRCRAELVGTPNAGYAGCCAAIRDLDLRERLGSVAAPTLVVGGLQDESTPVALQAELAARIPAARLEVLDDAAHLAALERAPQIAALLLDHLSAPDSAAASRAGGGPMDPVGARDATEEERYARGMAVRRAVLGDAHVDAAVAATSEFDADFQRYIVGAAWADVWTRDTIDRRTRSAIVLTAVLAANRMDEFAMHVRAARRNGLEAEEIAEVILTAAVYLGVPAANEGFRVARQVLAEET